MKIWHFNALIIISGVIAIYTQMQNMLGAFGFFKPLTTSLIILLVTIHGRRETRAFYYWVYAALLACLLGDILLLADKFFVFGLGAFLIGHACFTAAFIQLGGFKFRVLPLLLLLMVAGYYYAYLFPALGDLSLPVAIYNLVIVVMAWQAISLVLWKPNVLTYALASASLLFMFSDSIIALNKFVIPFEWSSFVVLFTYWLSITVIANVTVSQKMQSLLQK